MLLEKEIPDSFAICRVIKKRKKAVYCPSHDTEKGLSPALVLVAHTWGHIQEACGHSWQRLNWAMAESVQLAIKAGLRFDVGDFQHIAENYRPGYWLDIEQAYALACKRENMSACLAIEAYLKRPPFIVHGHRLYIGKKISECTAAFESRRQPVPAGVEIPDWLLYPHAEVGSFAGTDTVNLNSKYRAGWHQKAVKLWKVDRDGIKAANAVVRATKKAAKAEPESEV